MDYFNEYYELVRKQQETEYNYTYEDSFTSMASISLVWQIIVCLKLMHFWCNFCLDYSADYDKTFDEDEVELLPPATPSNDGADTIEVISKWFHAHVSMNLTVYLAVG